MDFHKLSLILCLVTTSLINTVQIPCRFTGNGVPPIPIAIPDGVVEDEDGFWWGNIEYTIGATANSDIYTQAADILNLPIANLSITYYRIAPFGAGQVRIPYLIINNPNPTHLSVFDLHLNGWFEIRMRNLLNLIVIPDNSDSDNSDLDDNESDVDIDGTDEDEETESGTETDSNASMVSDW